MNKQAAVFVTTNSVEEALELYDLGADYVILPHFLGGDHVSLILEDFTEQVITIGNMKAIFLDFIQRLTMGQI